MEIGIRAEMPRIPVGWASLQAMRVLRRIRAPMVFVTLASRSGYLHQDIDPRERRSTVGSLNPQDTQAVVSWLR
jgi:hypothetical protein